MRVAVVAPDLRVPGGVREKALFVARVLRDRFGASVQMVSLATSRSDSSSVLLHQPWTWRRTLVSRYMLEEFGVDHVGAIGAEIELARYAGRRALLRLVTGCDLVHAVCGTPAAAYAIRRFAGPLIVHFASFVHHERRSGATGRMSPLRCWRRAMTAAVGTVEHAALRRADVIIPVNATRSAEVRALVGGDTPVEVVHTGVDTGLFSPGRYREDGYLLTVGRLDDPRKNLPLLLRAYAAARGRSPGLPNLVLAGPSEPDPGCRVLLSALGLTGSVRYTRPCDRRALADLYRGASAFLLTSDEEGQGLVVCEAMASGLPVVATSCIGPSELITDGVDGLLTPVGDVDGLTAAIVGLTGDAARRRRMARAARTRAVRDFSLERAGARLCSVYLAHGLGAGTARHASQHVLAQA